MACKAHTVHREHRYRINVAGELTDAAREAFHGWKIEPADADTALTTNMDRMRYTHQPHPQPRPPPHRSPHAGTDTHQPRPIRASLRR